MCFIRLYFEDIYSAHNELLVQKQVPQYYTFAVVCCGILIQSHRMCESWHSRQQQDIRSSSVPFYMGFSVWTAINEKHSDHRSDFFFCFSKKKIKFKKKKIFGKLCALCSLIIYCKLYKSNAQMFSLVRQEYGIEMLTLKHEHRAG